MGLAALPQVWRRSSAAIQGEILRSVRMPLSTEVDEELRRLLERLADFAGPAWDGSVIARIKVRLLPLDWCGTSS
jgi:hypothetical protein